MSQTLVTIEKALKDVYLPLWNNLLNVEPSAFLAAIKKVPIKGNNIVASAPFGLSGGFGYGAEGQATPASGHVQFKRFTENAKDLYVNICISQKAVKLTGPSGSMADALQTEIKGAYETAKWNVGRSLFGNGTGILARVTAVSTATIDGVSYIKLTVDDTSRLKEGLILDVFTTATTVPHTNGKGVRLLEVDHANKAIVISAAGSTSSSFAATDFITVQNSLNREITGLGAIMYESGDTDYVSSLYGLAKSSNAVLNPVSKDAGHDIDDSIITNVLRRAEREKNSKVNMIMAGDDAYDAYTAYLRANNIRVEAQSKVIEGGFKAIKFLFGNREIDIVNESFVPTGEMWGVDTTACTLHQTDWTFADLQGGGIFNLMENQSIYRALLTNYGNLICNNPGGCIRIKNAA